MKNKKILITILSVVFVVSTFCGISCSKTNHKEINSITQKVVYNTGTSIDMFQLFEIEDGYTYTFKVGKKGVSESEALSIGGRYYYADKSGDYTAHLYGVKDMETQIGTADFTVSDTLPFMIISGSSVNMNYNSFIDIDRLINSVNIFIDSDTDVEYTVDEVLFLKNHYVTEGEEIKIERGTPAGDGFYDGDNRITFNREGVYNFHIIATNAGGSVDGNFTVLVTENYSYYVNLGEPNYDSDSRVANWNAIDGASYYRVKIDYENVITDQTSIDLDDYLIPEANGFQDFDLVIIPLDANKKELKYSDGLYSVNGMLIKQDVIIAPERFGNIVLGETTKVNVETDTVTLKGGAANKDLSLTGLMAMDSGYLGWKGDYGLNTYVEFEFSGNNIPNVIFFADEINNKLTYGGKDAVEDKNKGLMVISGIYGAYSGAVNKLVCGDTVALFGPFRYEHGWSKQYNRWMKGSATSTNRHPVYVDNSFSKPISPEYELLTQNGLKADTSGRTYKYVIGTYGVQACERTKIFLDMKMYDVENLAEPLFALQQDTLLTTDDFKFGGDTFNGGNIIVIAPSKEESATSEIKISKPFTSKPASIVKKGLTENHDGSYTILGSYPNNANSGTMLSTYPASVAGFRAYTGTNEEGYGLGTYLDITFKGNNMPVLTFFADETAGGIAEGWVSGKTGAGMLIINGLMNKNVDSPAYTNQLRIYGPYKYGAKNDAGTTIYNRDNKSYFINSKDKTELIPMAMDNLDDNTDYRLIIGAIEKNGYIAFDIQFVDVTTNKLLVDTKVETKVTVSAMKDALGIASNEELKGFIVASGAFKGIDGEGKVLSTTCKISLESTRPSCGLTFERYPLNITLDGKNPNNRNSANYNKSNQSWLTGHYTLLDNDDKAANYGLNTYLDITFTGNNLPILTFFAKEDSGAIANGYSTDETGAGIIIINGLVNKHDSQPNRTDVLRITGPYKYGAKDSSGTKIYDQDTGTTNYISNKTTGCSSLENLAQDNLVTDNNYRLIIGAIAKEDGFIYFDIQFKNLTSNILLIDGEFKTTVTVEAMKTALGITTGDLTGYIILNGAYKGGDDTTFTINAVKDSKITIVE